MSETDKVLEELARHNQYNEEEAAQAEQRPFVRWIDVVVEEEIQATQHGGGYLPVAVYRKWVAEFEGSVYESEDKIQDGNGVKMAREGDTYAEAKEALKKAFEENGWDVR